MIAAYVLAAAMVAYCLVIAIYCWLKHGADSVRLALRSEHRAEPDRVVAALTMWNPAYRFRRYSDDQQLVSRPLPKPRSIVGEQSR